MRLKRLASYRLTKNQLKLAGLLLGLLIALVGQSPARQSQAAPPGCPASAPTIGDIEKTNITDTTAKISWRTNYTTYGEVNYGTAAGPPYALTKADTVSGLSHSVTLDSLAPNTTYYFSIMAESAPRRGCDQANSLDDSFITLGAPLPPPPNTLTLSNIDELNINPTIATIVWTTNIAASSKVRFGTTVDYEDERTADGEGPPLNPAEFKAAHSIALSPLTPDTLYHYQVESNRTDGQTQRSIDRTFRTAAGSSGITLTIFNLGVYAECGASCQNPGDVTVRFQFETNDATNATASWGLNPGPPYSDSVTEPLGYRAVHEITQAGLNPNATYHYRITVVNAGNSTYTTGDITFDTPNLPNTHTFTTGACTDANNNIINIGACSADRLYCDGGVLVADCSQCGYTCNQGETCTGASPSICVADPGLSGNAYQCNKDECYQNFQFINPALPGCWESWPRCSANTVLKVKRDRVCDQWITCASSVEITEANTGAKMDLCTGLGGCASLGPGGTCNEVFGLGQCENDPLRFCNIDDECGLDGGGNPVSCLIATKSSEHPLPVTYKTPKDIDRIQNLTGSIVAGLDWGGATTKIEGMYPWFLAPQYGEIDNAFNLRGDFEHPTRALGQRGVSDFAQTDWQFSSEYDRFVCAGDNFPPTPTETSCTVANQNVDCAAYTNQVCIQYGYLDFATQKPEINLEVRAEGNNFEEGQNNLNHVLRFQPMKPRVWVEAPYQKKFTGFPTSDYFISFRIRTNGSSILVRPQFKSDNIAGFINLSAQDIEVTDSWQSYQLGPVQNVDGPTVLRYFFDDQAALNGTATPPVVLLDDVRLSQALETRPLANGQYEYVFPSCRLYPKAESEACTYIDENGAKYKGQSGYCLERDPKNPNICIAWWPVDAIRGEENAFASERSAGFSSGPLYYCVQSRMYVQTPDVFEEGCWADPPGTNCNSQVCYQNWVNDNRPNICGPGYHVRDDNAPTNSGFKCPGPEGGLWKCAKEGDGNDDCSYICDKDPNSPNVVEYAGKVKVCQADHRIPCEPNNPPPPGASADCQGLSSNVCEYVVIGPPTGSNTMNQCALVAKVADFGQNKAWADRVKFDSGDKAPPFNGNEAAVPPEPSSMPTPPSLVPQYKVKGDQGAANPPGATYQLDYPFGRVVTPENQASNPTAWLGLGVRTTCDQDQVFGGNPLFCKDGQAPGAIAGVTGPYAWTGKSRASGLDCDPPNRDWACVAPNAWVCRGDDPAMETNVPCTVATQLVDCAAYTNTNCVQIGIGNGICNRVASTCSNNAAITCESSAGCNLTATCNRINLAAAGTCSVSGLGCKLGKVCKNDVNKVCDNASPIGQPDVAGTCGKICQNNNALTCTGNVNLVDPTGACGKICQNNNALTCTANVGQTDVACGKVCQNNNNVTCTANPGQLDMACGGTCVGGANNGLACTTNIPDCPNGVCNPNAGSTCIVNPAGVCIADPAGICITDPDPAKVCQSPDFACNPGVTCIDRDPGAGETKQCSNDTFVTNAAGEGYCTKYGQPGLTATTCLNDRTCADNVKYCNLGNCLDWNDQGPGSHGNECQLDSDCSRCILPKLCTMEDDCYPSQCNPQAGDFGNCSNTGNQCSTRAECFPNTCTNNDKCFGGANNNNSCTNDGQCVVEACNNDIGGFCERLVTLPTAEDPKKAVLRLREIFAAQYGLWFYDRGQYKPYPECKNEAGSSCSALAQDPGGPYANLTFEQNVSNLWKVPDTACPGNSRPNPAPGSGSFCGIPPAIFNGHWKSGEMQITIHRGSSATLMFNTRADIQQKPLKRILIDWGDNYKQSYEFPYDAKGDPQNPHVFRHAYPRAGTYQPRGLVIDNWEWCSSGSVCNPSVGVWPLIDPVLKVIVE